MQKTGKRQLHKVLSGIMIGIMLSCCVQIPESCKVERIYAATSFDGGDGTALNPYRISEVSQFDLITLGEAGKGKYYVLTKDIAAINRTQSLINGDFYGVLDGNGHTVNLKQMLCYKMCTGGVIKNVNFTCNVSGSVSNYGYFYFSGCYIWGTICGYSYGTIDNCVGTSNVSLTANGLTISGGIVGICEGGVVKNCGITSGSQELVGSTTDKYIISGLMGQSRGATMANCFVTAKICIKNSTSSTYNYVGTLLGHPYTGTSTIKNCYGYNTATSADFKGALSMAAINHAYGAYTLENNYYRSARDPNNEWYIATSDMQQVIPASGLVRVNYDPGAIYAGESNLYRKWASSNSFATYANNVSYGRSSVKLVLDGGYLEGDKNQTVSANYTKVIGEESALPIPVKEHYDFLGWSTSATSSVITYAPEDTFCGNEGGTLYARWILNENYGQGYEALAISNKADDLEIKSHKMNPENADSQANLTTLKVYLKNKTDEITIYKVADLYYDAEKYRYDSPVWVSEVSAWVSDYAGYASPDVLSNALASEQKSFYTRLFMSNAGTVTEDPYHLMPYIPVDYRSENPEEETSRFTYEGDPEDIAPAITITGLEVGEYVVIASSAGHTFTPVVLNIVPERSGSLGGYFLMDLYEVSLKSAGANVTKYIVAGEADSTVTEADGEDPADVHMDTASVGAVKNFRIMLEMPGYRDRITISDDNPVVPYTMTLMDLMDSSMVLTGDVSDISLWYENPETNAYEELTADPVSYHAYADESYSGAKEAFDEESEESTVLGSGYYVLFSEPFYEITSIDKRPSVTRPGEMESGFEIAFNMAALIYWAKINHYQQIPNIEVRYSGTVTADLRTASEENINQATIAYEITDDGLEIATLSDEVSLYAYGLTIHKQDGDTLEPLAGAKFYLYKKVLFFDESASEGTYQMVDENYQDAIPEGYETLADFKEDSDFYIYSYESAEGQKIHAVFLKMKNIGQQGELLTTASQQGDSFGGLTEGEYILAEFAAPLGYNMVAEDMLFTIDRFTEEEAVLAGRSSLIAYKDINGNAQSSGYFDVIVNNYKGFILPTTGGMGTVFFSVIGVGLMTLVVVILITKKAWLSGQI